MRWSATIQRGDQYDPRGDSIVRVEAQLRRKLRGIMNHGKNDPLLSSFTPAAMCLPSVMPDPSKRTLQCRMFLRELLTVS